MIGIMQGRLSPPCGEHLQFFPDNWQLEFGIAAEMGFDLIEWNLDQKGHSKNPFWDHDLSGKWFDDRSVKVVTLCADYFMKYPLTGETSRESIDKFGYVLDKSAAIGIKIIGLPIHEDAAFKTEEDREHLKAVLNSFRGILHHHDLEIALEADLPADEIKDYLLSFDNPRIGLCYDTGNLASLGYDLPRDIKVLGRLIKEVHLKDRNVGSTQSVYLGTGAVDFEGCFSAFKEIGFQGPYIFQAWREEDYLTDARFQLEFVKSILERVGR